MGMDLYWGGELGGSHDDASAVQPSDANEDVSNADDPPSSIISSEHESDVSIVSESLTINISIGEHGTTPAECPQSDSASSQTPTSIIGSSCLPNVESSLNAGANTSISSQSTHGTMLPWGVHKERPGFQPLTVDTDLRPGEFVMRTLFADFTLQAERKMEAVMNEPLEKLLSKTLQRGEDPKLDQVLSSFGTVAEHCLPSLLRALFGWLERQMQDSFQLSEQSKKPQPQDQKNKSIMYIVSGSGTGTEAVERSCEELLAERRDLAVEFLFCLALIEVLKQLQFHPGHEDLVQHIENLAFKRFNYKEGIQSSPNAANIHIIADLYAEVIGVLAQARFSAVKKRFTAELKELKSREPSPHTTQSIISLLMGMKFFRVKMVPIEEFEASFQFLQECAQYFLEAKDKDVKHALAGLFVEILVPVAAIVKNEVNVPCLKSFVEMLYSQTLDASTKSKHRLALFPLVTCLLCVSQKAFFLANWHYFLAMCLSHLKNKDPKMCRVALESLYRLLWVYMIRIKCESNSATQSRLQSIVNSLFPKGSKGVVPRDTPLNIFVKIIQFIAQERLDFAMREIVFDLLMVGRPIKIIYTPERMSIGLRAFLVVADSLQQKEGEPPMPRTAGTLPSGNTLRVKKTYLNKVLTEETAKSIGMCAYFPYVRRVLVEILRALDAQYGRPLMMTNTQNITKEQEINTGERKPRIDLFRTCVAAIPRLLPDGMSGIELVEMLSRLTVHMDEELRGLAYQSLQTLIVDFPEWRTDVLSGFLQFLTRDVQDVSPQLVDNGLRMLLQLITSWKNTLNATTTNAVFKQDHILSVLRSVEAFSLVMLCQCRLYPHRIAVHVLREVKQLLERLQVSSDEPSLSDAADALIGPLIEQCLPLLPLTEKQALLAVAQPDLLWLADRTHIVWTAGLQQDEHNVTISTYNLSGNVSPPDPWGVILFGLLQRDKLPLKCPTAIHATWPVLFARINALFTTIDPTPVSDNRASLLRSAAPPRKPTNERDVYLHVWKNYLMMSYHVVPPIPSPIIRCASPDLSLSCDPIESWTDAGLLQSSSSLESLSTPPQATRFTLPLTYTRRERQHKRTSSSPDSLSGERSSVDGKGSLTSGNTLGTGTAVSGASPATLHKLAVQLLRCETADVRDAAVNAIGYINSSALKDLMEELVPLIREAVDRKQENMRRRRRRDALRLHLGRVLRLIAQNGTFANSAFVLENGSLHLFFVEYLDGTRLCLEAETDKDSPSLREVKLIFCDFVTKIIKNFPLEMYNTLLKRELRKNLFQLFAAWSGPFVKFLGHLPLPTGQQIATETDEKLHLAALQAMSALACCGPYFTPADLAEEGSLYPWLNQMLSSTNDKIYELATETVVLMLECNPDIGLLLDWTVDKCYTGEPRVADGCFLALSTIFSAREYPCDHYTAVINVTLMCTGCPRATVRDAALQLLQLLDARFFGDIGPPLPPDDDTGTDRGRGTLDALLCTTYCRSQLYLSRQLAHLHPELTMPMFSEITHRFQTARPEVRQLLLQYLLPWLVNIELVDPNVPPANPLSYFQYYASEASRASGRREGLGSAEATEMVLNNLFYITAKFSDCHPKEIEELWSTLCSCWPNNLKVIIRYLMIVSGMAPNDLLPYAKRVVVYLARSRSDRLLDEMMTELQTVETLNCLIERTETPPFYRLTSVRKTSSHSDGGCGVGQPGNVTGEPDVNVTVGVSTDLAEKGTIHTKRHSGEDPAKSSSLKTDGALRTVPPQPPPLPPQELDTVVSPEQEHQVTEESSVSVVAGMGNVPRMEAPQPRPLPMPEYGGYFAPLTEYLPDSTQPISGFHRCNVAVMLLCDVVIDGVDLDWSIHVPLMLHIAFLGMDHTRAIVHEHCRQLLLNLLVTVAAHHDHLTVARVLLGSCTTRLELGLSTSQLPVLIHNFTEPDSVFDSYLQGTSTHTHHSHTVQHGHTSLETDEKQTPEAKEVETATCSSLPVIVTGDSDLITDSTRTITAGNLVGLPQPGPDMPISDVIKSLIHFLANRPNNLPLWNYEDITAKVWTVRSCQQLNTLLQHVLRVFRESLPHALVSERWAQTALQLGLSCPSRHYAGRSLQVFRFIGVAMTGRMVSDMLSRLVETVAEQGEDMQGYVTELLLTLESAVDSLESNFRPLDYMRDIFKSTPNLNNKDATVPSGPLTSGGCIGCASNHTRSTSYSVSYCMRKSAATTSTSSTEGKEVRTRICMDPPSKMCTNLCRSRSAQSLKLLGDSSTQDDKLTILATLFWLGVSLLESDYEHEFLLGARLLTRVMRRLPLDRPDARDRVDRLHAQLRWPSFPGVHALLLKGCTHPATYEPVVGLLGELTPLLELSVVDPTQSLAFPMTVVALLPYMLLHYEDANELCVRAACHIAQVSAEKGKKLENLGTVMSLYSRRTFSKESFQWTKCVVKYLWDTYSHLSLQMLAFLVEVLEKGAPTLQLPVLSILHCMLHYVDLNASSAQPINADLLRVVAKFIDGGANFKEAMKILKLVVTRCSTLVVPPHWDTNTSLIDTEQHSKKELPGRTMDFTFDLSQTPVIGRRYLAKSSTTMTSTSSGSGGTGPNSLTTGMPSSLDKTSSNSSSTVIAQDDDASICSTIVGAVIGTPATGTNKGVSGESNPIFVPPINQSPRRLASLSPADAASISGWKRPWMSQGRVRECLVNLLTTCGQRVGLPKSPSVIFSQSSELVERESSMASSLEEVSAAAAHGDVSGASRCAPRDIPPTAPDHFAVFKDFDFLEYESESIEGESSDNFNWGVRRLLLSEETDQATPNSSRKLERNSSAIFEPSSSQHKIHHAITTPENTTRRKIISGEDSSDDELISESPPDEGTGNSGVGMSGVALGLPPRSLTLRPRTHSASSGSSGGGDLGDLTPCAGSSTRSHDSWKNSVLMMMLRECPPHAPILFVHRTHTILKEIIDKTLSLCLDGTRCLTSATDSCVPTVAVTTVIDQLSHETLPLIWVGPSAVSNTLIWEAIKYASLEMNEHLETYFDRKEHVVECLDSMPRFGTENIGRSLYKLLFQLILLLETYGKMVSSIYNAALDKNAIDCSSLVTSVKEALSGYEWGSEHGTGDTPTPTASACPSPQPSSSLPQSDDTAIVQLLNEFRWTAALSLIRERNAKRILERGEFPEDDLTSLLHIYCSSLMTTQPDMLAITRPVSELMENLSLMIKNLFKVSLVLKMNNLHSI